MSPTTKNELRSPTFLLAAAGMLLSVAGGVYTLGMQSQRIDAGVVKDGEQDGRLEKLSDKMDAGFARVSDKIDGLRAEIKGK
jgi:hypothetical protein